MVSDGDGPIGSYRVSDVARHEDGFATTDDKFQGVLYTTWVTRWKGLEVRSRFGVRGCFQVVEDMDKLFASTPPSCRFSL